LSGDVFAFPGGFSAGPSPRNYFPQSESHFSSFSYLPRNVLRMSDACALTISRHNIVSPAARCPLPKSLADDAYAGRVDSDTE